MLTDPPDPRSGLTHLRQQRSHAYGDAFRRYTTALTERVRCAAQLGQDPAQTAEYLELLRATLHIQIDMAVDAEALRHPSPRRLIFRAARYREPA